MGFILIVFNVIFNFYRLLGLAPFKLITKPQLRVTKSSVSYLYSATFTVIVTLILFVSTIFTLTDIAKTIANKSFKLVVTIAFGLITFSPTVKSIVFLYSHLFKSQLLTTFINEGIGIYYSFAKCLIYFRGSSKNTHVFDSKFWLSIKIKIIAIAIQLLFIVGPFASFLTFSNNLIDQLVILCIFYSHILQILMSFVYYVSMSVCLQYLRNIKICLQDEMYQIDTVSKVNSKKTMKIQRYCDLSDNIDRYTSLYNRTCTFAKHINDFFNNFLMVTFFYSFGFLICEVRVL